jgi:hypothetical protein
LCEIIVEYPLQADDYLQYQLYVASKSKRIQKKRKNSKIGLPIIYIFFSIVIYFYSNSLLSFLFIAIAIAWYFLYPVWEKHHYIKHYKDFIDENYKANKEEKIVLEVNETYLFIKNNGSESKVNCSEIATITELNQYLYIHLNSGQTLIVPKSRTNNLDELIATLKLIEKKYSIEYKTEPNWEWK